MKHFYDKIKEKNPNICPENEKVKCMLGQRHPYCDVTCPLNKEVLEIYDRTNKKAKD